MFSFNEQLVPLDPIIKYASLLKLELLYFISVLQDYRNFLLKTQNFVFRSSVFYLRSTASFVNFIVVSPVLLKVNWASVERHVYKLQRIASVTGKSRQLSLKTSKLFFTSVASHLFISRFLFNSKISIVKKLDTYQKFNLATSFDTGGLLNSTAFLKYTLSTYLKQHLVRLIVEPQWRLTFDTSQILKKRHDICKFYENLSRMLPVYILRVDLRYSLQSIKSTTVSTFTAVLDPEIKMLLLKVFQRSICSVPNFYEHSIYSLVIEIITYYLLKYVSSLASQNIFFFQNVSSKGIILFKCRDWYTTQNLEVKLRAWLSSLFHKNWCRKITFSYHREYNVTKLLNSKFSDTNFFFKYLTKESKPKGSFSLRYIWEILGRVKHVLCRFNTVRVVVSQIRGIFRELLPSPDKVLHSKLFFQVRYKLIQWVLRKHRYLKSHEKRKQYVQYILKQLKSKNSFL